MESLQFKISSRKNRSVFAPSDLLEIYLVGIPIASPTGERIPDSTIEFYIRSSVDEVEKYFGIQLTKKVLTESLDFERTSFQQWGFIKVTNPIHELLELKGAYANVSEIVYPKDWFSIRKTTREEYAERNIRLVPNSSLEIATNIAFSAITPLYGIFNYDNLPNYWRIKYISGFFKIPNDLLNVIGKLASINIFHNMGDLVLGAGVASISIGLDGLSQSIGTTSSATNAAYGSRISGYEGDLKKLIPKIKSQYGQYNLEVV